MLKNNYKTHMNNTSFYNVNLYNAELYLVIK